MDRYLHSSVKSTQSVMEAPFQHSVWELVIHTSSFDQLTDAGRAFEDGPTKILPGYTTTFFFNEILFTGLSCTSKSILAFADP